MVATSPLRSGQEMSRMAEFFIRAALELSGFDDRQGLGEGFEYLLTLGFFLADTLVDVQTTALRPSPAIVASPFRGPQPMSWLRSDCSDASFARNTQYTHGVALPFRT